MQRLTQRFSKGQAGVIPVLLFFLTLTLPALAQDKEKDRPAPINLPSALPEPPPLGAEKEENLPPALKEYLGRRIAHTMHWKGASWLTRTEREREEAASVMLKELKLKPGMIVCDLGCGNGYHSLPMAKSVAPNGKVLAVDIQPEMLKMLEGRAQTAGIKNVELIKGSLINPNLPEGQVDRVLMVDTYHEFSHPVHMLKEIHKSLKPDGMVVLVEYRAEDKFVPIKKDHKMSKAQVMKELEANGFELADSFDDLPWQHMLFFRKAGSKQ